MTRPRTRLNQPNLLVSDVFPFCPPSSACTDICGLVGRFIDGLPLNPLIRFFILPICPIESQAASEPATSPARPPRQRCNSTKFLCYLALDLPSLLFSLFSIGNVFSAHPRCINRSLSEMSPGKRAFMLFHAFIWQRLQSVCT